MSPPGLESSACTSLWSLLQRLTHWATATVEKLWPGSHWRTLLVQHDITVDHTMLSGVARLSNLRCSTVCDNVCWTMLKGYVKLTYICWTTNQIYVVIIFLSFPVGRIPQLIQSAIKHGRRTFLYCAMGELVCSGLLWARTALRQPPSYKVG